MKYKYKILVMCDHDIRHQNQWIMNDASLVTGPGFKREKCRIKKAPHHPDGALVIRSIAVY